MKSTEVVFTVNMRSKKSLYLSTTSHQILNSLVRASELAQVLNVSQAKIYSMRAKEELESIGYRAEANGRFLSFIAIE